MVEIEVDPRVAKLVKNLQEHVGRLNAELEHLNAWRLGTAFHSHHRNDPLSAKFLAHALNHIANSKAQVLQDVFVDFVLNKEGGRFLEFGATNGLDLSNSHWLEHHRSWTGVLGEPAKNWHEDLARNRPDATVEPRCVWHTSGQHLEFYESGVGELSTLKGYGAEDANHKLRTRQGESYLVETVALNELCATHFSEVQLDYMSVDTEGSEFDILEKFDFERLAPTIVTVEHNMTSAREKLYALFVGHGYVRVFENLSAFDDWYVKRDAWDACKARYAQRP